MPRDSRVLLLSERLQWVALHAVISGCKSMSSSRLPSQGPRDLCWTIPPQSAKRRKNGGGDGRSGHHCSRLERRQTTAALWGSQVWILPRRRRSIAVLVSHSTLSLGSPGSFFTRFSPYGSQKCLQAVPTKHTPDLATWMSPSFLLASAEKAGSRWGWRPVEWVSPVGQLRVSALESHPSKPYSWVIPERGFYNRSIRW